MKIYIFWITLLDFIRIVLCSCEGDKSGNASIAECSVEWFRRKRALTDYKLWRADQDKPKEFIVVLDDEVTTNSNQKVMAINIERDDRQEDKIIIDGSAGGETNKITQSDPEQEIVRDYTRFVPPTTEPNKDLLQLAPIPANDAPNTIKGRNVVYQQPVVAVNYEVVNRAPERTLDRYWNRDDSPPASPQFLARTPSLVARQYVPIVPVTFRHHTIPPVTPRYTSLKISKKWTTTLPTRTTELIHPSISRRPPFIIDDFAFRLFEGTMTSDSATKTTEIQSHGTVSEPYRRKITKDTIKFFSKPAVSSAYPTPDELVRNFYKATKELLTTESDTDVIKFTENTETSEKNEVFTEAQPTTESKTSVFMNTEPDYNTMFYNDDDYDQPAKKTTKKANYDGTEKNTEKDLQTSFSVENITIDNLDNALDYFEYEKNESTFKNNLDFTEMPDRERRTCSLIKLRPPNFSSPRTLPEITTQLKQWADTSPIAKWLDITQGNLTIMENPIHMMIIDDLSSGQQPSAKQTVLIIAGIQGRDHHAVSAAMYVLSQLIDRSEFHSDVLSAFRFWIIPVFNPDGYEYSMTFPNRRDWAKNLRQRWEDCQERDSCVLCEMYGLSCNIESCYGVNLDRNFEYQWIPAEKLKAEHPCGALYAGPRQLSETETRAFTQYMHQQGSGVHMFIAMKEGDVLGVMYPYSHTKKKRAFDQLYRERAMMAARAAHSISARKYVAGQTSEFLPLYAGGIEDWVDGHLGIDHTYTIMMFRPSDTENTKIMTERVAHEAYVAVDTLLMKGGDSNKYQAAIVEPVSSVRRANRAPSRPRANALIYVCVICTISLCRYD